jgi:hypothetical protein
MSEAAVKIIAVWRAGISIFRGDLRAANMPTMDAPDPPDGFYASLPLFRDFTAVMDPALFTPLPSGWVVGVADVMQSTKAIAENRYKAVNMAGAAVIVAVTNAMAGRDFPFVFGGDGASFAVPAEAAAPARQALAETATWVKDDLDLTLRIGMAPVTDIRAQGLDVRVARYAPSENISIAMFTGGGMAWADAAMKQGSIAVEPAPPGAHPDLSGLSCRYEEIPASRGLVLSLLVAPGANGGAEAFRAAIEQIARIVEKTPDASRPVPGQGLRYTGRRPAPISRRARRAAPASLSARARSRCWCGRCCISWSCASASRSAASFRRNTPANWSTIPISGSSTIRSAWCSIARPSSPTRSNSTSPSAPARAWSATARTVSKRR